MKNATPSERLDEKPDHIHSRAPARFLVYGACFFMKRKTRGKASSQGPGPNIATSRWSLRVWSHHLQKLPGDGVSPVVVFREIPTLNPPVPTSSFKEDLSSVDHRLEYFPFDVPRRMVTLRPVLLPRERGPRIWIDSKLSDGNT